MLKDMNFTIIILISVFMQQEEIKINNICSSAEAKVIIWMYHQLVQITGEELIINNRCMIIWMYHQTA
jgi:hypothetical protein